MALTRDDFNRPDDVKRTPAYPVSQELLDDLPPTPSPTRSEVPIVETPCDCEDGPCGFRHWEKEEERPDHEA